MHEASTRQLDCDPGIPVTFQVHVLLSLATAEAEALAADFDLMLELYVTLAACNVVLLVQTFFQDLLPFFDLFNEVGVHKQQL